MKRIFLSIALACASISTAACDPLGGVNSASVAAVDDKLLYAAEAAYNVPAFAYVKADSRDQLSPALKAQIKPKMQALGELLDKARSAHALGNATLFNANFDQLKSLAAEISAMLPK